MPVARLLLALCSLQMAPRCRLKVGFFLLGLSQWRLEAGSSCKGNLQKPANPTHFRPQLGTPLASVLEFFGWGVGSVACFFLWWGAARSMGSDVTGDTSGKVLLCWAELWFGK